MSDRKDSLLRNHGIKSSASAKPTANTATCMQWCLTLPACQKTCHGSRRPCVIPWAEEMFSVQCGWRGIGAATAPSICRKNSRQKTQCSFREERQRSFRSKINHYPRQGKVYTMQIPRKRSTRYTYPPGQSIPDRTRQQVFQVPQNILFSEFGGQYISTRTPARTSTA
jgi:hypothetical protein